MDSAFDVLQALGIGIALGMLVAATGRGGGIALVLGAILGAIGGAIFAGIDDASLPADAIAAALGGLLAAAVIGSIVAGAIRRGGGGTGTTGVLVTLAGAVIGALSVLFAPLVLIPLAALLLLASARRRRAQRKHEGLRVLR